MDNGLISSLAALISETVMMIAAILLVCAIVLALRTVCAVVIALCVLYLLLMGALVYFAGSNPGPMG